MKIYTTHSGQNIYDIALTLYGSVEGVFDLLVSNPDLSLEMSIPQNTKLSYHPDFMIHQDIAVWFEDKGTLIKNGNSTIDTLELDVKKAILAWIIDSNKKVMQEYKDNTLSILSSPEYVQPQNDSEWSAQSVASDSVVLTDRAVAFASKLAGGDLGSGDTLLCNLTNLYSSGAILIPDDNEDEYNAFIAEVSSPQIIIQQIGGVSCIKAQITAGSFVAVDWGDDSPLEYYHYTPETLYIEHYYTLPDTHTITIYGKARFANLDMTEVGGIYYALTNIIVLDNFITPYPNITELNQLFKNGQEH